MSVPTALLSFLTAVFFLGSRNFFLAMCVAVGLFVLLEIAWNYFFGGTVSRLFWEWAKTDKKRSVIVASLLTLLGLFFTLHLIFEI